VASLQSTLKASPSNAYSISDQDFDEDTSSCPIYNVTVNDMKRYREWHPPRESIRPIAGS
jgi:hypothetical protein